MEAVYLAGVSFSLAVDAMSVSMAEGLCRGYRNGAWRSLALLPPAFGAAQAGMTAAGWGVGTLMPAGWIDAGRLCAGAALCLLGGKMIREGMHGGREEEKRCRGEEGDSMSACRILFLSLATSVDAFVVGFALRMRGERVLLPAVVIGLVTLVLSAGGVAAGGACRNLSGDGDRVEWPVVFAGTILILLGMDAVREVL